MWYLNLQQPNPLYQYTYYKNGKIKLPKKALKWSTLPLRFINQHFEGEYCPLKYVAFEPGSRQKIMLWMKKYYNWEPTIFTASGSPKIDAETLAEMNISDADDLKRYLKVVKDLGQLSEGDNSLLALLPSDNRFKGSVDTLGTNTGRMSHSKPNITQLPKAKEFRELLRAAPGKVLIDVDADALELVMLGHYLGPYDNYFYAQSVDSGDKDASPPTDIHSINQRATGLPTRDLAKTFIYGYLYGSGNTRIGWGLWTNTTAENLVYTQVEYDAAKKSVEKRLVTIEGKQLFPIAKDKLIPYTETLILQTIFGTQTANSFLAKTAGLKEFLANTKKLAKANKLKGLYGHHLEARSPHSAGNLLLQHAGAIFMKYYLVVINRDLLAAGFIHGRDFGYVANIHDAVNIETTTEHSAAICDILSAGFSKASIALGLTYHVHGKPKIGVTQYDVH